MKDFMQEIVMPFHRRIARLFQGKLVRASAGLFVGGVVGGMLGYVFQVVMGRMLSTAEYGLFSAMMALFVILGAPLNTLMLVISRKVSEYRAMSDNGSITHLYFSINIRTLIVGVLVLGTYLLFAQQVQTYLKAPSIVPVYLLGAMLFLTFPTAINNAFLQGMQRFSWLSASTSLGVLFKLACSSWFIWLGYGLSGAVGGVVAASLVLWLVGYGVLHQPLTQGRKKTYQTAHLSFKSAIPVLIANAAFATMTQIDMVLVNFYFPQHEAGLYASASILGKAVMYLPGGIVMALFPMVAENHARKEASAHLLFQAVMLTALLCGAGAIFYYIFGEKIVALLYGQNYREAGEVLKYFGIAMIPMALVLVAENFLIAKGKVLFAYLFLAIAPLQLTAIYFFHQSLQMVVIVIGISGLILAIIGYGLLWQAFRSPNYLDNARLPQRIQRLKITLLDFANKHWGLIRHHLPKQVGIVVIFASLSIFILTLLKAGDLITGAIPRRENVSHEYSMLMGEFPADFKAMTDYLSKDESQYNRILWYPLNFANYIFIPESLDSTGVFAGTSFLRDTTRQRDYPGFYNLGQESIKLSMMKGDLKPLCHAIWQNNINLVITNNYLLNDKFRNRFKNFFSYERAFDIYEPQRSKAFTGAIFGEKVATFGQGYELHRIQSYLLSDKVEVYEGNAWADESKDRNWCAPTEMGKLTSTYKYDADATKYDVTARISNTKNLSVILAEELGYRYHLVIESPAMDEIDTVNYKQDGAKFIANVKFKKPQSGKFIGRLESHSRLEKYMKPILGLQALLLLTALLYVIFRKKTLS